MTEREEEVASALPAELDSLPRRRGFRLRGIQMTPIEKIAWSGWVYFSMVVLVPLHRSFYDRRLKANQIQSRKSGNSEGEQRVKQTSIAGRLLPPGSFFKVHKIRVNSDNKR